MAQIKEVDTIQDKYLTFLVRDDEFGIEIQYIEDIIKMQDITKVPGTSGYIIGITNLRGTIVPVMDIRIRFGIEKREYDERTCIIVISVDGMLVGIVVDAVLEVLNLPASKVTHPPKTRSAAKENRYVRGIASLHEEDEEESVKLLLDISQLLYDGDPVKELPVA